MKNYEGRITSNPHICSGKSCIKGTRIPVHIILDPLTAGEDFDGIKRAYSNIDDGAIKACISYAAMLTEEDA